MNQEELGQAFLQNFAVFRTGQGEAIHEADTQLQQMCMLPNATSTLTIIATQNEDEVFRKQALVLIKVALKGLIGPDFNPVNLVTTLLTGLSNEPNFDNRKYYVYLIGILTNNEETLTLSNQFVQQALASDNQLQIHTAVLLCNELIKPGENNSLEYTQFVYQLVTTSFKFNDPSLAIDAIELAFNHTIIQDLDTNQAIEHIWAFAISLIPNLVSEPKMFWEISAIFGDAIDKMAPFANITALMPVYLELLKQDGLDDEIKGGVVYVLDSTITYYPKLLADENLVVPILQRYIAFAVASYQADVPSDDYETGIMANICKAYRENPQFVEAVWSAIQGITSTDEGKYVSMLILNYLFTPNEDFFYDNMDDIVDLMADSLTTQSASTYEAAIKCLTKFFSEFREASEYAEVFIPILIENVKSRVSISTIEALACILKSSDCTDPFFNDVYQILMALLSQAPPEFHTSIIYAISMLASRSEICINDHYQQIMGLMQSLLQNPNKEAEMLKVDAIDGISNLIIASPENFLPYLESFVPLIITQLQDSSTDITLTCPFLNCLGHIINLYAEQIKPLVGNIVPIVAQMSLKDLTPELNSLKEMEQQNALPEDIDDNLETPIVRDAFEIAGLAFMVYISLIRNNPELLPECFENIVQIISQNSKSVVDYTERSVCKAIEIIMQIVEETKFQSPHFEQIYISLMLILTKTREISVYGDALTALASFIQVVGLEILGAYIQTLPDEIDNILQCNIPLLQEDDQDRIAEIEPNHQMKLPSDLYQPLSFLLFAIFSRIGQENIQAFMGKIMPALTKYTESQSFNEKAFALDILMCYTKQFQAQDPAFLQNLYNLAISCAAKNRVSGFLAIKGLSQFLPDLLKANAAQVLQLFGEIFTTEKKKGSKNSLQVTVTSVAAFGEFSRNVLSDEFPIEQFGHIVLSLIQPGEDLDETLESYNFLLWLLPKGMPALINDFVGALAKLFAQPPKYYQHIGFPNDQLAQMKDVFGKLLSKVPNGEQVCSQALKNDPVKLRFLQEVLK